MELYIGGYAQGKLEYVMGKYRIPEDMVCDGAVDNFIKEKEGQVYNHFHLWVRRLLEQGEDTEAAVEQLLEENPSCIIISDEIGNGIVPMEAFEREYREKTGRLLCKLAARADRVERVICGIGQQIK